MAQSRNQRTWLYPAAWPLRLRLTVVMLIVALTPVSLLAVVNAYQADQQLRQGLAVEAESVAEGAASQLSEGIDRLHNVSYLMAAAQGTRLIGATIGDRENYLNGVLNTTSAVNRLTLVEPDGTVILSTPRVGNVRRFAVPDSARQGKFSTGATTDENGKVQYTVYAPVTSQNDIRMVLVVTADFAALLGRAATTAALPRAKDGAFIGLTDAGGRVVFASLPDASERIKNANLAQDPGVGQALVGKIGSAWTNGELGDVHLSAAPVAGTPWVVFYAIPGDAARAGIETLQTLALRNIAVLFTVVILGVVAVATLLGGQVVKPILHVGSVMSRVRQGELTARVQVHGEDEMGRLGQDINETLDSVVSLVQTRDERDALQRSIYRLLDEVSEVASGNLTVQAQVTADQLGAIADSFNYMIEELRGLVHRTQATADEVTNESRQVTGMTHRLVSSADQQAQRLDEARASVSLMTDLMSAVRATVSDSVGAVSEARVAFEAGQQVVGETTAAMSRLRNETRETAKKIKRLGESSQEVGEIVRLINEIADQTHLLALNASIQAAMAGEHGRGFAVVAEEVRALAERSASATEKIDELIRLIQTDTNAAMVAMERSTQEVVAGSRLADKAGETLAAIGAVTERVVELSTSIEGLVQRQVSAADYLQATVGDVATTTVSSLEDVRAVAIGMQTLEALSASLRESVSVFRVATDQPEAAEVEGAEADLVTTPEAA